MKSKLHLSKSLLPIFNFNGVKEFLQIMSWRIFDHTLENNIFSHSANPLLNMCLLYEFLQLLTKKFFSLSYTCRQLMDQVKKMIIEYIESVDDENFLTSVMLEKDYTGRDSLQIAVELEVLDLIQAPKVEAVIKRIWNSDYDTSGSFFEMSTPYQILTHSSLENDVEETNRFYKKREIDGKPQYDSNFNIFQQSMNSRLKGMGIISSIFVIVSIYYFNTVISRATELRPIYESQNALSQQLLVSGDEKFIVDTLAEINRVGKGKAVMTMEMFDALNLVLICCVLNLMFFVSQVLQMIFLKKIGRLYNFPTVGFFTDLTLFVVSIININWIVMKIDQNVNVPGLTEEEKTFRIMNNISHELNFKFEYLLSIMIGCMIWKILEIVQFSADIGPLVKIVEKMFGDFGNFIILYAIIVVMFAIIGNINFVFEIPQY